MVNAEPGGSHPAADMRSPDWLEAQRTGYNPQPVSALQIETSSICNFRCDSCPLSMAEYDRPEKQMTLEQFRRVLDAYPTVKKLELQGLGEVFLNPCVIELVREASARGLSVHTFSNASKIERGTAFEIVRAGLDLVNFSMDGADEATFRRLRKGGTLKRYKRCVTNLLEAKAALGSKTPTVGIMTVLSKANLQQVPRMLAIAEELGVETIMFTKLNASSNDALAELQLGDEERAWIRSLPPYRGKVRVVWSYGSWTHAERVNCYWPQQMSYVTVEGDVTPCCNYYDSREIKLGNAFEQDGAAIWNGEPYRAFRRRLMSGDLPDRCRTC